MASQPLVEVEHRHNGERLLEMIRLRAQKPDYHPLVSIAKLGIAAEADPESQDLALKAHTTVLRYIEPELKSVEVANANKRGRTIEVSLFDDTPREVAQIEHTRSNVIDVEEILGANPSPAVDAGGAR